MIDTLYFYKAVSQPQGVHTVPPKKTVNIQFYLGYTVQCTIHICILTKRFPAMGENISLLGEYVYIYNIHIH